MVGLVGPSEPPVMPLEVGETVFFGEGQLGTITRAYPTEDKFAVKVATATSEIRGENRAFFYFRRCDLGRAVPDDEAGRESKRARGEASAGAARTAELGPPRKAFRLEGHVKWYSKDKGFGKIAPAAAKGSQGQELLEQEIFMHVSQMEGGPEGPHAQAIAQGVPVSYNMTTYIDGRPCACAVEVQSVARTLAHIDSMAQFGEREDLVRRLLHTGLQCGSAQLCGAGKTNNQEDRYLMKTGLAIGALGANCARPLCAFFGVFDGHAGAACSDFAALHLERALSDSLRQQARRQVSSEVAMRSALLAAFRMTEHNYFQSLNKLDSAAAQAAWASAGSTACTAAFYGPDENGRLRLAVANAGDSRVVLGGRGGEALRLSEDHTPDLPSERRRIEQAGAAVVNANGIWRIVPPSKRGLGLAGLSVSRGFGDLEYKHPNGIVSAIPDVVVRGVDLRQDSFLVFASDGVWNPVSDADAVRIVSAKLQESSDDPARLAAEALVEEAQRRDVNDDKTAVVVWFGDVPTTTVPAMLGRRTTLVGRASGGAGARDDIFRPARALVPAQRPARV